MAPTIRVDPDTLEKAAANVLAEPRALLGLAQRYVDDAALPFLAFGVVGQAAIAGPYEASRAAIEQNIANGVGKLTDMANGLARAAANIRKVERANTIDPARKVDFPYTPPTASSDATMLQGLALAGGFQLAPLNLAIATTLSASAALAPTAIVATALWALFSPNDAALQKAVAGWKAAGTQVGGVDLDAALKPLDWDGDDRDAFDQWVKRYVSEVKLTQGATEVNHKALDEIRKTLNQLQLEFFAFAVACLGLIIVFTVCSGLPYVGPIFKMLVQVQGAILSSSTGSILAAVVAVLTLGVAPAMNLIAQSSGFAKLEVHEGGGTGFTAQDLAITWTKP